MSRSTIADELATCAALWPSLAANNPRVLDAYQESLLGFSDDALRAGFRRVRQTHAGVSFPKPAQVAALCAAARNRFAVAPSVQARRDAQGCEVICTQCGTVTLYHELTPAGELGRLWPWHLDGCALRRADQPTDTLSRRVVMPQAGNGGMYRAPETVRALIGQIGAGGRS